MKISIWIIAMLVAAFMIPAVAQQDTNSSQSQPAAQNSAGPNNDGTLTPLSEDRHEGFWGKINPMARKKYVQRQMEPIRNRVNELDELTAANTKMIKDVDARAQEGIRMASAKADLADQHASDANNRATMAGQTADQANTRVQTVSHVVENLDQYQAVTDTEIRLRPGEIKLSKKAAEAIDGMASSVQGQNAYLFEVQGFAGGHGAASIENSQHMAETVVRYLVINHDIPVYRIYMLGMGNTPLPASAEGKPRRASGGRVEVSLLKNPNLEQLNSVGAIPTSGNTSSYNNANPTTTTTNTNITNSNENRNSNSQPAPAQSGTGTQDANSPPR